MADFHWPPLESNPEIFEQYMSGLGLPENWGFSELYGFDEALLGFVPQPVIAVIVNYERLKSQDEKSRGSPDTEINYYMKQTGTLDNACGVIACIHSIYNNLGLIALDKKKTLHKFLKAVEQKTPEERATILEGFTEFREQHKAFASKGQSNLVRTHDDVKHHYVAFVINDKGQLVELDGTKQGPLVISENCTDVLRGSIAEIQKRLADGVISESLSVMTLNAKD